jgi:hypothetical protein
VNLTFETEKRKIEQDVCTKSGVVTIDTEEASRLLLEEFFPDDNNSAKYVRSQYRPGNACKQMQMALKIC